MAGEESKLRHYERGVGTPHALPLLVVLKQRLARLARLCSFKTTVVALSAECDCGELTLLISRNCWTICWLCLSLTFLLLTVDSLPIFWVPASFFCSFLLICVGTEAAALGALYQRGQDPAGGGVKVPRTRAESKGFNLRHYLPLTLLWNTTRV